MSRDDLRRARTIAIALEKSFTSPMPPEAMVPAPLLEEIEELGNAGLKGMIEHLNFTNVDGVTSSLLAIKELNNEKIVPELLDLALSFRWPPELLKSLRDTILFLAPDCEIPKDLSDENLANISKNIVLLLNNHELNKEENNVLMEDIHGLSHDSQYLIFRQVIDKADSGSLHKFFRLFEDIFEKTQIFSTDLVNLVVSLGSEEGAIFLANLNEKSSNKKFKSLLRKSIFRLEKKGISVKTKIIKNESSSLKNFQEEDFSKAICSSTDGSGRKILWIARSKKPKGRYLAEFNLKTESGIEDLSLVETTSKEIRNFLSKIEEQDLMTTVEIPISYGFWLLERAQLENEKLGVTPPSGFTKAKMLLDSDSNFNKLSDLTSHPIRGMTNTFSKDDERIDADVILNDKLFKGWYIDDQFIRSYVQSYIDSLNSNVALDEKQKNDRLDQIIESAANKIYEDKTYLRRLATQLEENSYLYYQLEKIDFSSECFKLANELVSHKSPPSFFVGIVRSTVLAWSKSLSEQKSPTKEEKEKRPEQSEEKPMITNP
ncbi:MAG: hypothetical protein VX794_01135 [Nitrospinota bacterium]|nr:hypothetical protein [Nitrospinota bacterium]